MYNHQRTGIISRGRGLGLAGGDYGVGPFKQGLGVAGFQVDASVAHWLAKIVVPIRTVKRVGFVEEHDIRDIG